MIAAKLHFPLKNMPSSLHMKAFRRLLAPIALCSVALTQSAEAQLAPVADFFRPPAYSDMLVSPSGKRLSATVPRSDGRRSLVVLDLDDLSKSKVVAGYQDADIRGVRWVNDERLVFELSDPDRPQATQRGSGLFSVSAAGGEVPRELIRPQWNTVTESTNIASRALQPDHVLEALLRDGSNDVIVAEWVFNGNGELLNVNLKRLDTATGLARSISQGAPKGVVEWTVDLAGVPRVATTREDSRAIVYWKPAATDGWVKVAEGDAYTGRAGFSSLLIDANNRLYASQNLGGRASANSLVMIDLASGAAKPRELLSTPGFDFHGSFSVNNAGTVLGVSYLTDARAALWFDAGMKTIQQQVDALLPGTVNQLDCGNCDRRDRVLVTSYSDRQPATYRLFDSRSKKLEPIADSRPWITPRTMAARDMVRITTRDGLSIPVHITRPNGQRAPGPTVVLVHGGPWVRGGEWRWIGESQFLASRGYVVVEPEFRGSTGFGFDHFRAGWKQWGLAMQDDVVDAALWAVNQGHADAKRICIAGASYGGYAALMGLIRNPETFRCGVEWVGVTDIDLMYSITWSDASDDWKQFGMPRLIGDRAKDSAQLAATSPIKLANKVTQPLLMAYGGVDRRVPIDHGTQFRDAVRTTNKQVEWIEYPEEGHGWRLPANQIDFWSRVEKFLDKNLRVAP